jgi:hypothetical protein
MGISGVWKGFFITASEYISYTLCSTVSAVGSTGEVRRTNLVPEEPRISIESKLPGAQVYSYVPVAVRRIVILNVSPSMVCAPELEPVGDRRLVIA